MDRQTTFLWMQDLLEHLNHCHEQWQSADDHNAAYLAEAMRRDLDELRRLCDSLRRPSSALRDRRSATFAA